MKRCLSTSLSHNRNRFIPYFIGLTALLVLCFSCKKDEENTNELDDESAYNIALQEDLSGIFNALLDTYDSARVIDSVFNLFLENPNVSSGKISEQAIIIDYNDGSRGGIFFDSQDFPEEEFSFPDQLKSGRAVGSQNIIPGSKRSIMINPHYFERKNYTDYLLRKYDELLPEISWEVPERYFNDACNLGLFTKLEDYGFIHIYSHGLRLDDDTIYLMTGERPNGTSHNLYNQQRFAKRLVCFTISANQGSFYFILPDFIREQNHLSNDKPLIFGGFCYSYLGGWPEMFNNIGAAGYFGFDWAVRTVMHAYWAKSIMTYMTDYSADEPYSAKWWLESAPADKKYWIDSYNRWINIEYKGHDNLVLWDWENLDLDFTSFNLSLKVNAGFEDSEGGDTYDLWSIPYVLGHSVDISANKFTKNWDYEPIMTGFRSGSIEILISPSGKNVIDFWLKDTVYHSGMNTTIIDVYNIRLKGLPLVYQDENRAVFEAKGADVCNFIYTLENRTDVMNAFDPDTWEKLVSYDCISPESEVLIYMFR